MTRLDVAGGFALDLAIGDPHWLPHPIRAIGWLIQRGERIARRSGLPLKLAGVILCATTIATTAIAVWITTPWANVYWIYSFLAVRSLDSESAIVIKSLNQGELERARQQTAMIVGRDTARLDEPEIVRAVIETVSENLSDAVIAPMFYLALLGPAGMAVYKAANTLDSMVGYKDERHKELGWASARFDDLLNFIPARLTALLVALAAALLGMNAARAIRIAFRDGNSQPSPNSGWPEAAFAGALGVQLGGTNYYRCTPTAKAHLGDPIRPLTTAVFFDARKLLYGASILMLAGVLACL